MSGLKLLQLGIHENWSKSGSAINSLYSSVTQPYWVLLNSYKKCYIVNVTVSAWRQGFVINVESGMDKLRDCCHYASYYPGVVYRKRLVCSCVKTHQVVVFPPLAFCLVITSVLWQCWLGDRKVIQSVEEIAQQQFPKVVRNTCGVCSLTWSNLWKNSPKVISSCLVPCDSHGGDFECTLKLTL